MNVMYLGKFCDADEFEMRRAARSPSYVAQYSFERALVEEWLRASDFSLSIVSLVQGRSFPSERLLFWRRTSDIVGLRYLGYVNLPYLRELSLFLWTFVSTVIWALKSPSPRCVFLATHFVPTTAGALLACRLLRVSLVLTLTDLTGFSYSHERLQVMPPLRRILARTYRVLAGRLERAADGYVLFTEGMRSALDLPEDRCLVMEGMFDPSAIGDPSQTSSRKHAIAHAGTLNRLYGIQEILDVFELIEDPDLELWLLGAGDMDDEIARRAAVDRRIKPFGLAPRQRVLEILSQAALLVNFRDPRAPYTALSFPSKLLEYMATGTAVLSTRLAGIPADYWEHLYAVDTVDRSELKDAVLRILATPQSDLTARGCRGREFVLQKKSPAAQAGRMKRFVEEFGRG